MRKLLNTAQYGARIGRRAQWVREACEEGRIPEAQRVGNVWIIPEDALIRPRETDIGLPPYMLGDPVPEPEYRKPGVSPFYEPSYRLVSIPGYARVRKELGLTQKEVYRLTGVNYGSQRDAERGGKVRVSTARRLAKGLDVDINDLLRRN